MSVDHIPILIDEQTLVDEISRLRKTLATEMLDSSETQFHEALFYEHGSKRNQYTYAKLEGYKNTRWSIDANLMRFQVLNKVRETVIDDGKTSRNADVLFQFFGAFFCCFSDSNPLNEFGFHNSTIIGLANSRRLHSIFQQIDFELLRPIFNERCKRRDDGGEYSYIRSFEELVNYAKALDGLLIQAIEQGKMLYIYAG